MAKKKFQAQQKQLKAQQRQQLATGVTNEPVAMSAQIATTPPITTTKASIRIIETPTKRSFLASEIIRTTSSLVIVIILLVAVIITGDRTAVLHHFGSWLVKTARLTQ